MDDTSDRDELIEKLQNGDGEVKGFAIPEGPGRHMVELIQDIEQKCKDLFKQDQDTQRKMFEVMARSLNIAHAMFSLHFYSLPFHQMHKTQSWSTESLFDDEAKKLCALVSADLTTLQTVALEATRTMDALRKHMDPVFKKRDKDKMRKETLEGGEVATEKTTSNVIDFEERRGQSKRKETLH